MRVSRRRRRKRLSNILILAGILGIGIWVWSLVRGEIFQKQANQAFERQTNGARPVPGTPLPSQIPPPKPGDVVGRLLIPRLHLQAMIREGTDGHVLDVALGHVSGTALPGRPGNIGIAGHRDTLFRCLRKISKDDRIVLETTHGTYDYSVNKTSIVKPQDIAVLAPSSSPEITLVTCYPFYYVGPAPDRFIVQARLLPVQAGAQPPAAPNGSPPAKTRLLSRAKRPPARTSRRKSHLAWLRQCSQWRGE